MSVATKTKRITKDEARARLKGLDAEKQKRVLCGLVGHSKIVTMFWGYVYCGRCGEQVGDKLASSFDTGKSVVVGHNCDTCQSNFKALTWQDTMLAPDPFKANP